MGKKGKTWYATSGDFQLSLKVQYYYWSRRQKWQTITFKKPVFRKKDTEEKKRKGEKWKEMR